MKYAHQQWFNDLKLPRVAILYSLWWLEWNMAKEDLTTNTEKQQVMSPSGPSLLKCKATINIL